MSDGDDISGDITLGVERASAKPPTVKAELNLAGFYVWKPPITDAEEIALFARGQWHPATDDFLAVMGSDANFGMGNFEGVLATIAQAGPGSIQRVNFMTHANRRLLGISGTNDPSDVTFDVAVTDQDIKDLESRQVISLDKKKRFSIDDIRARFAKDAIFVLYACNAGNNVKLMQALHDLLHVKIIGSPDMIGFCPPPPRGGKFVRKGMRIGINKPGFSCPNDAIADWRKLIDDKRAFSMPP